jgi:hypothetical protein
MEMPPMNVKADYNLYYAKLDTLIFSDRVARDLVCIGYTA